MQGMIELTYRCSSNCIHCYCKGSEDESNELNTYEFKKIIDEICREGCVYLNFTGGDPTIRPDFLELYAYARSKGFLINLFVDGQALARKVINYLSLYPPYSVEITLHGITKNTYESVTQIPGSFERVMTNINLLVRSKVPLFLKTNCLKANKNEIGRIKRFTEELLGKPKDNKYYFKYDPMIYPRLNGDNSPCRHRLSFEELEGVRKQDSGMWREYRDGLHRGLSDENDSTDSLYICTSWMKQFFISPYGRLKFCEFSDKFSIDLKKVSFREGFYNVFPELLKEKFKTDSKCKDCSLRVICYFCPARMRLETGNEEYPVDYYCQMAEAEASRIRKGTAGDYGNKR